MREFYAGVAAGALVLLLVEAALATAWIWWLTLSERWEEFMRG